MSSDMKILDSGIDKFFIEVIKRAFSDEPENAMRLTTVQNLAEVDILSELWSTGVRYGLDWLSLYLVSRFGLSASMDRLREKNIFDSIKAYLSGKTAESEEQRGFRDKFMNMMGGVL